MSEYKLHTILINKRISLDNSKKWIIKHGYKIPRKGVHITTNFYRFRGEEITSPAPCLEM